MAIFQGQVGPQVLSDGTIADVRMGKQGDSIVSELDPRYYEQVYRGNVFFASTQNSAVTFAANGLTTSSAVGLIVYNPTTSTKNLVPVQVELAMSNYVTTSFFTSALSIGNVAAAPTVAGALTIYQTLGAKTGGSVASAATSVTFSANSLVWKMLLSTAITTTIASAIPTPGQGIQYDLGGALVLSPGTGIGLIGTNASTGFASMSWMELPV